MPATMCGGYVAEKKKHARDDEHRSPHVSPVTRFGVENAKMLKNHWFYCYFWRCHGKPEYLNRPNDYPGKGVWEEVGGG